LTGGKEEMKTCPENINGRVLCPSCGEGNEKGARFCVHCGGSPIEKRKIFSKNRYLFYGMISLVLIGVAGFALMGSGESALVGKVNGEGITRKDFIKRLERARKFYEDRYGQNLFEGDAEKENLNRLKSDVLDEMTVEKILLQEAKTAGYTSVPEEEIGKQLETIKKAHGLSDTDLQKRGGRNTEDLKAELRDRWMISQFVEKTILKGDRINAESLIGQWLTEARAKAKIETYEKLEPVSTVRASCCRSGCGGGSGAQPLDPKVEQEAKAKGLEYYEKKTQKKGASARVTNFGCHIQVDIIEDGKVVVSLTYREGEVQEI
jgi:hypothetical protein